jgi:hypothetical protein
MFCSIAGMIEESRLPLILLAAGRAQIRITFWTLKKKIQTRSQRSIYELFV